METVLFLLVDGITNGAVYGLVALSLIIVYTVTRVVNIAQGEYVTVGALSFAAMLNGVLPTFSLAVAAGISVLTLIDLFDRGFRRGSRLRIFATKLVWIASIVGFNALAWTYSGSYWLAALAAIVTTTSLGPLIYRLTVEPAVSASPIVLVIVSVGVYMVMHGLSVLFWGAQPLSIAPVADGVIMLGSVFVSYQSLWICALSLAAMLGLYLFSERTLTGQALQAAAINRTGAQLCGIPVRWAGQFSFALGAMFSALSGMLLAPLITANYDMGLPIGLKAFVAAALGGIVEYPTALIGVALVGTIESFAAFNASAFRDVIVFLLVIPILLWRNAFRPPLESEHS